MKFHVINYHITNSCNYHCTYCFGKFREAQDPSLDEAKHIIDNIHRYFIDNDISDGRITFSGGEPTKYKHLDELIAYTHSLGITISIITNGSFLKTERIRQWAGKVSCIAISIDSIDSDTNQCIGRCRASDVQFDWKRLASTIRACGMALKVNTVVSKFNLNEDLSPVYLALKPDKIKFLQMHLVDGINDAAKPYAVTEDEFHAFCQRYASLSPCVIVEPCKSMENSYLMINPQGEFLLNDHGKYRVCGDCKVTPVSEILKSAPLDESKYEHRYSTPALS